MLCLEFRKCYGLVIKYLPEDSCVEVLKLPGKYSKAGIWRNDWIMRALS